MIISLLNTNAPISHEIKNCSVGSSTRAYWWMSNPLQVWRPMHDLACELDGVLSPLVSMVVVRAPRFSFVLPWLFMPQDETLAVGVESRAPA